MKTSNTEAFKALARRIAKARKIPYEQALKDLKAASENTSQAAPAKKDSR